MKTTPTRPVEHAGDSLTQQVLRYQRTGCGFQELMRTIGPIVYCYPTMKTRGDEDDRGEFYCHFAPRIPSLLRRFTYRGKPFEAYLLTSVAWQYKTFISKKSQRYAASRTVDDGRYYLEARPLAAPETVCERPTLTEEAKKLLKADDQGVITDPVVARRVVLLLLKASDEVDADTIEEVARVTGTDPDWLSTRMVALRERRAEHELRRSVLRRRRDRAFFRMCYYEQRLRTASEPEIRSHFARLRQAEREHFDRARRDLARVRIRPNHRDIGRLLGMPKGSVDSALYYLRNTLSRLPSSDGKSPSSDTPMLPGTSRASQS